MTLNQTWKNCLRMWKWVAEQKKLRPRMDANDLKREWLAKFWKKKARPNLCCFFCEYHSGIIRSHDELPSEGCQRCPGYLVDKQFHCQRLSYHWFSHPIKFYRKLLHLDAKRRTKA